jgi:hypothetical protein
LKFYQQLTGDERRIPFIFDDLLQNVVYMKKSRCLKKKKGGWGQHLKKKKEKKEKFSE